MTIWNQRRPYRAIWGHTSQMGPNRALRGHIGPYGMKQNHTGPYSTKKTIYHKTRAYRATLEHIRPCGTIWDYRGSYRAKWGHMRPYRAIWDHSGSYRAIPEHMDHTGPNWPYWTIQDQMGPYLKRTKQDITGLNGTKLDQTEKRDLMGT